MKKIWSWTKRIMAGLLILILVLTVLTYAAGAFAKRQLARDNLPPGQWTNVGEYNMHIYCTGEGSPTITMFRETGDHEGKTKEDRRSNEPEI